jgi:hypothetical protein
MRPCERCGTEFKARSKAHRFCSPACRDAAKAKAATAPDRGPSMRETVDGAIAKMSWLTEADQGLVATARTYADQIDASLALQEGVKCAHCGETTQTANQAEITKAVYMLAPNLQNTLKALGGSPHDRKALDIKGGKRGRLQGIREKREASQ